MSSEMITLGLMMANVAAMAAIFVYSACSLSVKRWTAKQPDYWIHSFLVGGSIAVIGHTAGNWQLHHWTEVMFNVAAAAYFMLRSHRIHLLAGILQRNGKDYLKIGKETK